jgi:phage tail sheath protein FI|nr:MAG TPA: tail sheath tube [Caudoviricetes sp.]
MAYQHGINVSEESTNFTDVTSNSIAQVVIGTAPVNRLDHPEAAVNVPVLCESISDCQNKLGYSTDFKTYTLCQSMYTSFLLMGVAPVVFINVLDPQKHKKSVSDKELAVNNKTASIPEEVIVSSLVIKVDGTEVEQEKYVAAWNEDKLMVHFTEELTGTVSAAYDVIDPTKVTAEDIIGAVDLETGKRTGAELIKDVFPSLGVVPFLLLAPGWTTDDTVGAVLANKTKGINGCYNAVAILDLDTSVATTRAKAIEEKKKRTTNEMCLVEYPMVEAAGQAMSLSALKAALIMYQAVSTGGVTCSSPSNQRVAIQRCVLANGDEVYFDQEDGNELNAEGICTVISRNGFYTWGNNTAAYPDTMDPKDRWIMARLVFNYIENMFINTYFSTVDGALTNKMVEDILTDENIILSSYTEKGYIAGGKISYNAGENPESEILNGHFRFHTAIAANVPGEYIHNVLSFDVDALETAILGGE